MFDSFLLLRSKFSSNARRFSSTIRFDRSARRPEEQFLHLQPADRNSSSIPARFSFDEFLLELFRFSNFFQPLTKNQIDDRFTF